MDTLSWPLVIGAIVAIIGGPTGAAWIGARSGMNGIKANLKGLKDDVLGLRSGLSEFKTEVREDLKDHTEARHRVELRLESLGTLVERSIDPWDGNDRRGP